MAPFRSARPRPQGDDVIYMTRIGDVVAVSDSDIWIEHALQRGVATLSADAWFESDFIRGYEGGNRIEAFFRPTLTANLMYEHARRGQRGPLNFLRVLLPPKVMGELVARAAPAGPSTVAFEGSAALANDGFDSMDGYLQSVYNAEKGDLRYDFSDEGIGRVVPDRRTLAAAVVHAKPEDVLGLAWTMLLPEEKSLADDQVRGVSRRRGTSFTTFQQFAEDLVSDLGDTHAVVVSRPSRFVGQRYETFEDESDPPLPGAGLTVTLVAASSSSQRCRPGRATRRSSSPPTASCRARATSSSRCTTKCSRRCWKRSTSPNGASSTAPASMRSSGGCRCRARSVFSSTGRRRATRCSTACGSSRPTRWTWTGT
jgi:hypothetical protein